MRSQRRNGHDRRRQLSKGNPLGKERGVVGLNRVPDRRLVTYRLAVAAGIWLRSRFT